MSKTKKQIALTVVIVVCAVLYVLLGVLSLITKSFPANAILHIYLRMLIVPVFIKIFRKCFCGQITHSMNKALVLCSSVIFLDMVIIDAVRYVLSHGVSTVLFLPVCIPICFMITMIYSSKDTGRDKKSEKTLTYLVGIPLLLLSLYLEVLSFVQIWSV